MTGFATDREIAQQPAIWREWGRQLPQVATRIRDWLAASPADEIWLCGAGTSAFIGDSLAVALDATSGRRVRSVATTDLVARPADHVQPGRRPLVVSFGRSGNSSESVGTLDILDRMLPAADRLNITCNAEGVLARRPPQGPGRQEVIVLPAACHDAGFAMTSSYSTMYLTALACLGGAEAGSIAARMAALADGATALLAAPLALPRPGRVVFLGAGPLTGAARESALKVLELTAGRVVTSWESMLGFRHGPKAVVDDATVVVGYVSADVLARRYDDDMIAEIRAQFPACRVLTVGPVVPGSALPDLVASGATDDAWAVPLAVTIAQRLAVDWSRSLGLNVDDPFAGRNLTRVVANVRLHA